VIEIRRRFLEVLELRALPNYDPDEKLTEAEMTATVERYMRAGETAD
jgi:hypothetical protein